MAVMVLLAVGLGWFGWKLREAERQRRAVEAIREVGAEVIYDYEFNGRDKFTTGVEPPAPAWLRDQLGVDFFSNVVAVQFHDSGRIGDVGLKRLRSLTSLRTVVLYGMHVADAALAYLRGFPELECLWLVGTLITDAGLENLKVLTRLEYLSIHFTPVTDAGLEYIKGLPRLRRLDFICTPVTEKGVEELRKALPNCEIHWTPPPTPKTNLDQP